MMKVLKNTLFLMGVWQSLNAVEDTIPCNIRQKTYEECLTLKRTIHYKLNMLYFHL